MKLFGFFFEKDKGSQRKKQLADELFELNRAISASDSCFNEVENPDLARAIIFDKSALEARRSAVLKELKGLDFEG